MTLSAGGGPANKVQNYGVKTLKLPGWQAPTFRELVAKGRGSQAHADVWHDELSASCPVTLAEPSRVLR
jgi:hypothetical protein